jgi:2-methylcitrate dehydratase PrpD
VASNSPTIDEPLLGLARFSANVEYETCPATVLTKARALLLYAIAVGVTSAKSELVAKATAASAHEYGDDGHAALCLVNGRRASVGAAAFCNAVLCHVRIQDDAHPAGHLGTIVVPAALALGQSLNLSGRDLLASIVSGYEVSLRIGRDHAADLSSRGFRTTSVYGVLGAAAASARLLKLDPQQTTSALAFTTHCAGGLREFADAGTDEYPFQAGFSARNGITAAFLAQQNLTGTGTALTGKAGLFPAFGDPKKDYAYRLLDNLGSHYETERVTYKPYPGGQFHRGIIKGFAALRDQANGSPIKSAEIRMHPFEAGYLGLSYKGPFHTYTQAFFSAPFCAALAWLYGTVTFEELNRFDRPEVLEIVGRTDVIGDATIERYKPILQVVLQDGRVLSWSDESGEGSYDLTWDIACDMTREFCSEAKIDQGYTDALIEKAADIDTAAEITPFLDAAVNVAKAVRGAA